MSWSSLNDEPSFPLLGGGSGEEGVMSLTMEIAGLGYAFHKSKRAAAHLVDFVQVAVHEVPRLTRDSTLSVLSQNLSVMITGALDMI